MDKFLTTVIIVANILVGIMLLVNGQIMLGIAMLLAGFYLLYVE